LPKHDAYLFLRQLLNPAAHKAKQPLKYDTHLDFLASDSLVRCEDDHLVVDQRCVRVLTMKEPPTQTYAHILEQLNAVDGEFNACLEYRLLPAATVRKDIQTRRRHFFNKQVSMVNYLSSETPPQQMLVDTSAVATVAQLGDALDQLENQRQQFGECSLTLVLYDLDPGAVNRAAAEAIKVLAAKDGAFFEESYNAWNAWLAIHPGNHAYNLRRLTLSATNVADLSFLFTIDRGQSRSAHLDDDALAIFETHTCSPYWWDLHEGDVGHTLILGKTGSGKSFFLNFILTMAQRYDPTTVIFDIGHSFRPLARVLGGSYLALGDPTAATTLNPFACEPTSENLNFLHGFVRLLLEGGTAPKLSPAEDRDLYKGIVNLYQMDPDQQRLYSLIHLVPRALKLRLARWLEGGRYGRLFDNEVDTLSVSKFQVFDFSAQAQFPDLLDPLLFYLLHRVNHYIATHRGFKVFAMDESWRFIQHPKLLAFLLDALKTARKANAAMVLATQEIGDFKMTGAAADLIRTVVQSCPNKFFLANQSIDRAQHTDLFGLNDMELDRLANLEPKGEVLLKRTDITKVLKVKVDPRSYWLYTNTPADNARREAAIAQYGFEEALNQLARPQTPA
jgi:type IV secretion system protein VirB4